MAARLNPRQKHGIGQPVRTTGVVALGAPSPPQKAGNEPPSIVERIGRAVSESGFPPGSAGIPAGEKLRSIHWRSRGYLPHFEKAEIVQSITFRLHDSVPEAVVLNRKTELDWLAGLPNPDPRAVDLRRFIAKYEDSGHGACWLREPRIAEIVEGALLHFDQERYRLLAWCVMPNHVHTLIATVTGHPLDKVVHGWKSFTASKANEELRRSGTFWFREYHDRFIRDQNHLHKVVAYIEGNPVAAGLVAQPEDWRFGSAFWRMAAR